MDKSYAISLRESPGPAKPVPSLVRGTKSSTAYEFEPWEIDQINAWAAEVSDNQAEEKEYFFEPDPPVQEYRDQYTEREMDTEAAGHYLAITCEAWRGIEKTEEGAPYTPLIPEQATWKANANTDTRCKTLPPVQFGDRWTERLSDRGKKQIEHSAMYMHRLGIGYRTFLTLTFTPEWRAQIEKWDQMKRGVDDTNRCTIGNLVTEFINVLQQRHRNGKAFSSHYRRSGKQVRGGGYWANGSSFKGRIDTATSSDRWTPIKWRETFKLEEQNRPFQFVWVVENPTNMQGEANPHVHILMNWGVKLDQFHAWARWIEKTWGKGFAKLERIKKPAAAAAYMAKAAHYLTKGSEGDQGRVRGNRYGIANDGRAPKSRLVGLFWSDMIWQVLKVGRETERDKVPKGLWFHRWGFGASSRAAWRKLWRVLNADGVKLTVAPKSLWGARLNNAGLALLRRLNDYQTQATKALFDAGEEWANLEKISIY